MLMGMEACSPYPKITLADVSVALDEQLFYDKEETDPSMCTIEKTFIRISLTRWITGEIDTFSSQKPFALMKFVTQKNYCGRFCSSMALAISGFVTSDMAR